MVYDFEIVYKKGTMTRAADALSRVPSQEISYMALSFISPTLYQKILSSYDNDDGIQKVSRELQ